MYCFMSSLTALATVALYTSCDVKHSLFRGQLSFFQQLHPDDVVLGFTMFLLWDEITADIFQATATNFYSVSVKNLV